MVGTDYCKKEGWAQWEFYTSGSLMCSDNPKTGYFAWAHGLQMHKSTPDSISFVMGGLVAELFRTDAYSCVSVPCAWVQHKNRLITDFYVFITVRWRPHQTGSDAILLGHSWCDIGSSYHWIMIRRRQYIVTRLYRVPPLKPIYYKETIPKYFPSEIRLPQSLDSYTPYGWGANCFSRVRDLAQYCPQVISIMAMQEFSETRVL